MIRLPRRLLLVLASATVVLVACDTGSAAVRIGDTELTHERLEREVAMYRFLSGLSGAPCGTPLEGESEESACARFALTNVIREELVNGYGRDRGLSVDDGAVSDAIAQLEQNLGGAGELDARLDAEGLTRSELEAFASRAILAIDGRQLVVDERLDDAELEEAYQQQLGQFTTVEVSHILVPTRREAERIAGRATRGNFAELARELSQDPGSAPNGGSLGAFSESQFLQQFDPGFTAGALALEPGAISGPVQTGFGWHVILLVRRDVAAFEDVREQLVAQQGGVVFAEWLLERYGIVEIDVNPRYGRLDATTGEVLPVRSTADEPDAGPTATGP